MLRYFLFILLLTSLVSANELVGEWTLITENKGIHNKKENLVRRVFLPKKTFTKVFVWNQWSKPLNEEQYSLSGNKIIFGTNKEIAYFKISGNFLTLSYPGEGTTKFTKASPIKNPPSGSKP